MENAEFPDDHFNSNIQCGPFSVSAIGTRLIGICAFFAVSTHAVVVYVGQPCG
jgi:hypothetical protein